MLYTVLERMIARGNTVGLQDKLDVFFCRRAADGNGIPGTDRADNRSGSWRVKEGSHVRL